MKLSEGLRWGRLYGDAPHAGARIEIADSAAEESPGKDAPHAGARIEIASAGTSERAKLTPPRGGEN